MTENDQPRPELDAAIDAVLPSLTAVRDEAAAASQRRSRIALAETSRATASANGWRWGVATAAVLVAAAMLALWRGPAREPGSSVERRPAHPVVVTTSPAPLARSVAPVSVAPERIASGEAAAAGPDRRRSLPVRATSTPDLGPVARRPDPLVSLVRAVQEIPEEAWTEGLARSHAPLAVPDVSLAPIVVAPLETPAIVDTPADPVAPGEP